MTLYMPLPYRDYFYTKRPDYDPDIHGREIKLTGIYDLEVSHISQEAFMHYRGMKLQKAGNAIFSEPVFIPSNIENGWGCFSLCNTKRIKLLEYGQYYFYPDWNTSNPNWEVNDPVSANK